MYEELSVKTLIGEVLTHVDFFERYNGDDRAIEEILLTTQSGRKIRIYHSQDCCEYVRVQDTEGNWNDLIGKVIIDASEEEFEKGNPPPEYPDSWTRTNLTFKVDGATVVNKWIGESNGWYSESVNIKEIFNGN